MLPLPALYASDRLSIVVMALLDAVGASITALGLRRPDRDPAPALFFRLSAIIRAIIRLTLDGPRTRANLSTPSTPAPAPRAPSDRLPTPRLPPGWVLDLLPDNAPAIAADLAALLADPACATLLAVAPALHRRLRPVLRALGLTTPSSPSTPPPATPLPNPPPALPTHPSKPAPAAASSGQTKNQLPSHPTLHVRFVPWP